MHKEVWFVKRTKESETEKIILFFDNELLANVTHHKSVKNKDARIMFGNQFPKTISNAWQ